MKYASDVMMAQGRLLFYCLNAIINLLLAVCTSGCIHVLVQNAYADPYLKLSWSCFWLQTLLLQQKAMTAIFNIIAYFHWMPSDFFPPFLSFYQLKQRQFFVCWNVQLSCIQKGGCNFHIWLQGKSVRGAASVKVHLFTEQYPWY